MKDFLLFAGTSSFQLSLALMLYVLFTVGTYANEKAASPELQLVVADITKPENTLFSEAKAYSGKLANTTARPIRVEAVQMPGGYLGSGTFYPCEIQFWNGKIKLWRSIGSTSRRTENSAGLFFHAEMKPNETLEVCRTILTKEEIKGGRCARFALSFQWNHKPDIISKPFVIPDPDKPGKSIQCPQ